MDFDAPNDSRRTGSLYGAFAFASIVLTCFGGFFYTNRYFGPAEMVPVTFALGGLYAAIGILSNDYLHCGKMGRFAVYYAVQCTLLTVLTYVSPFRGFFGLLVLPVASQAIFDLRPR